MKHETNGQAPRQEATLEELKEELKRAQAAVKAARAKLQEAFRELDAASAALRTAQSPRAQR